MSEAFDEWIGNGRPAFRERPLPTIAEAVEKVQQSGGITSLAHPYYYGIKTAELVPALLRLGVDCVEAFHNSHPDSYRYELLNKECQSLLEEIHMELKTGPHLVEWLFQSSNYTLVFARELIPK